MTGSGWVFFLIAVLVCGSDKWVPTSYREFVEKIRH